MADDEYCEDRVFHDPQSMQMLRDPHYGHIATLWSDDAKRSHAECGCGWVYESGDCVDVHRAWGAHVDMEVA